MELEKLDKLPDDIRPRGRAATILHDFLKMDSKYARLTGDDVPRTFILSLRNEILKPNSIYKNIKVYATESNDIVLEKKK